jgi:hypothetical protein
MVTLALDDARNKADQLPESKLTNVSLYKTNASAT